jgi:hypothetical protein
VSLSLADLRVRRGVLVERARAERAELAGIIASQRPWLNIADAGVTAVRFCLQNKHLILIGAATFALAQPRRALRWALRAVSLFRLVYKLRRVLHG